MAILTLGISFRRAPIELLERLSFADDELAKAYRHALDVDAVDEAVILSTCNRVEITANVPSYHAGFLALKRVLTETRGVAPEELAEPLYSHWEQDAADHLFAVAAGLDSMVLGETQIHAQVREALRTRRGRRSVGPRDALAVPRGRAGGAAGARRDLARRRARRVRRARRRPRGGGARRSPRPSRGRGGRRPDGRTRGAAPAMAVASVGVRVLNRSLEHARALAERTGDDFAGLDDLPTAIADADLVVSATGAAGGGDRRRDRRGGARTDAHRSARPAGPGRPARRRPRRRGAGGRAADRHPRHPRTARWRRATPPPTTSRGRTRSWPRRSGGGWCGAARDALAPLIRAVQARGDEAVPRGARPLRRPSVRPHAPRSARRSRRSRAASRRSSCTTRSSS